MVLDGLLELVEEIGTESILEEFTPNGRGGYRFVGWVVRGVNGERQFYTLENARDYARAWAEKCQTSNESMLHDEEVA